MSLFVCEQCGHVENSALSRYALRHVAGGSQALCSDCDPQCTPHKIFKRKPWDGQIVKNPEVIARFVTFKCEPTKCSHMSLGSPRGYHVGARCACSDCGIIAEIVDIGQKRRAKITDRYAYRTDDDLGWQLPEP